VAGHAIGDVAGRESRLKRLQDRAVELLDRGAGRGVVVGAISRSGGLRRALTPPLQTVLLVLIALAIGFRFDEGFVQACGVVVTVVAFGLAFTALAGWVGLCVGDPETAQTALLVPVLPLVFASSAFSPVNRLPGFMQPVATWNPVTSAVDLSRSLAIGGPLLVPFVHFALWVTAITVLFTYLGVRRYRRATSGE
jgi:ABC-2 type transport system permease protein/oleandomycin transport system permease protein